MKLFRGAVKVSVDPTTALANADPLRRSKPLRCALRTGNVAAFSSAATGVR
jgi:hypothetical protein